jgi:hypothetical protein
MPVQMIDSLDWYERKDENDKTTSNGYGARFDPVFKGVKVHDYGDTVRCKFEVPWWMTNAHISNLIDVLRRYHILPNIRELRKKKRSRKRVKRCKCK